MINRRKNSISLMRIYDKAVGKFFRQGGSLVRHHPIRLSENPIGFCISVFLKIDCYKYRFKKKEDKEASSAGLKIRKPLKGLHQEIFWLESLIKIIMKVNCHQL